MKHCQVAGIEPGRLGSRGIGSHSLRKTASNDPVRHGPQPHKVGEFAGHSDVPTPERSLVRKEEADQAAVQRIRTRLAGRWAS
jgi:hypothetical protein